MKSKSKENKLNKLNKLTNKNGKKLKVLFVHQNFPGQFKHLAPALVNLGCDVLAMPLRQTSGVPAGIWNGVKIIPYDISRSSTPNIHPWAIDFESKIIRAEGLFNAALNLKNKQNYQPDIIISHYGWGESLLLKQVWSNAKLGVYCEFFYDADGPENNFDAEFSNPQNLSIEQERCRLYFKNLHSFLTFQNNNADLGICPTFWQRSTFPQEYQQKISVIHDGIDTNFLRPNPNIKIKLSENLTLQKSDEIITFVNRNLEPYRGYHIFMRCLPELLKRRPNAHILIVGGDKVSYGAAPSPEKYGKNSWKNIFINEVRPQISDQNWQRVHFLGNVPYQNFIGILQISSVHIYLTYPFVLSWSLLEAMSCGAAIVTSDTEPLREVIKDNETGKMVNFFDKTTLINTICHLLDNPQERQRLGENARQFAINNYDLQSVCLPKQIQWVKTLAEL